MQTLLNTSLKRRNTFGIDACAARLHRLCSDDDLQQLAADDRLRAEPRLVLGGGSNLLFAEDFDGTVLSVETRGIDWQQTEAGWRLTAAAGEPWHGLVLAAVERDLAGLENLALIPGTVGAAPVQNIGAYGVELESVFESLTALDLETGEWREFQRHDCEFDYRDSVFKSRWPGRFLITEVRLLLPHTPRWHLNYGGLAEALGDQPPSARAICDSVMALRRSKLPDPALLGNAGSFFKNPVISAAQHQQLRQLHGDAPSFALADGRFKVPAAWLIEQAGWKGYRDGDAGVSPDHALVLVNHGNASGAQLWQLAQRIQASVDQQFGISLDPEPRIIA